MLNSLHVHNFALIEDAKVEFTEGFNVFTGETGAGKSILIDAFGLVLGQRASLDFLRQGATECWVQAIFDIGGDKNLAETIQAYGIDLEEDSLFLERRLNQEGKSKALVNGKQVPVQVLRQLAQQLVDIHGQHENQQLLQAGAPLALVDLYGEQEIAPLLRAYQSLYTEYIAAKNNLARVEAQNDNKAFEIELLTAKIEEIKQVAPQLGEDVTLRETVQRMSHSEQILQAVAAAHTLLQGDEESSASILDGLVAAQKELEKVQEYEPSLGSCANSLNNAWIALEDVRQTLGEYLSREEFDGAKLTYLQERLDAIFRLKKKYGGTIESVLGEADKAQRDLEALAEGENSLEQLKKKLLALTESLCKQGALLTEARKCAATAFAAGVTKHIADLAMPEGKFVLQFTAKKDFGKQGVDDAEFLFTANLGMPLRALSKVASGGELSRLALAIKTVLLAKVAIATMVFDEIDTGVGGVTAQKMAEKIAIIAKHRQVICLTHLAQIACFADNHIFVEKINKDNETATQVHCLDSAAQEREITRMLSGSNITVAAQQNASELLHMAVAIKKGLEG